MMQPDRTREHSRQKAVARRYKSLGYDVTERPAPDLLPEFLQGMTPDVVARSESDNVVIEVKMHASLKGSNDLVNLADRISEHPDWRFELVVLDDDENGRVVNGEAVFEQMLESASYASSMKMFNMAYVYLTAILGGLAEEVAKGHGVRVDHKSVEALMGDLGFKGVVTQDIVEESLAAFSVRNSIVHAFRERTDVSENDVEALANLCERLRQFR